MTIKVNAIINDLQTGKRYRILYIMSKESMVVIEMDMTKFNVFIASMKQLINDLETRYAIIQPELRVVDENLFSPKQKENYRWRKKFIDEVQKIYGPSYLDLVGHSSKECFKELYIKQGIVKSYAWKFYHKMKDQHYDNFIIIVLRILVKKRWKKLKLQNKNIVIIVDCY